MEKGRTQESQAFDDEVPDPAVGTGDGHMLRFSKERDDSLKVLILFLARLKFAVSDT